MAQRNLARLSAKEQVGGSNPLVPAKLFSKSDFNKSQIGNRKSKIQNGFVAQRIQSARIRLLRLRVQILPRSPTSFRVRLTDRTHDFDSWNIGLNPLPEAKSFSGCSADDYTGFFWKEVFAGLNPATQTNFSLIMFFMLYISNMKTCTRCKKQLEWFNFSIVNSKTGKIASMCKICLRAYNREYWSKVKHIKTPQKNERTKLRRIEIRKFIINLLQSSCCADCGINDWRVLEFDHRIRKQKNSILLIQLNTH